MSMAEWIIDQFFGDDEDEIDWENMEEDYHDDDEEDPEVIHKGLSFVTYWRCADGREMLIKDMADDHLHNAILFLERKLEEYKSYAYQNDNYIRQIQRKLDILESERLRRGLPVPLVSIKSLDYRRKELNHDE